MIKTLLDKVSRRLWMPEQVVSPQSIESASEYLLRVESYKRLRTPVTVSVGEYAVSAAGGMFLRSQDLDGFDLLVTLTQHMKFAVGGRYQILAMPMQDFGGACVDFARRIEEVVTELKSGKRMLIFCDGGLGRTGTLLASLIAVLESKAQTPDPIATMRQRYHPVAVETFAQAKAVFALRGESLPEEYKILAVVDWLRIERLKQNHNWEVI